MKIKVPIIEAVEFGSWFEGYSWTHALDIYNFRFKILSCEKINIYENFRTQMNSDKLILVKLALSIVNLCKKPVFINDILDTILISDKFGFEVSHDRIYFSKSNLNPKIKYTGLVEYILPRDELAEYCITFWGDKT